MANRTRAFAGQATGSFFVDSTCIDCGTCYEFAPEIYRDAGEHSSVHAQPATDADTLQASLALVACPTSSIGTDDKRFVAEASRAFPLALGDDICFCGYTAESSFGAWSYLIQRPAGNVLVDSPRFAEPLAKRIEALGGARWMVLSHRDDVADHAQWRERLGCERVMHAGDRLPGLERLIHGEDPVALEADLLLIPTPGHTAGSQCLLFREQVLFSGDHLWWNPHRGMLSASRSVCWHDWPTQLRSLEKLTRFSFRRVLPGHGYGHATADAEAMRTDLGLALAWLQCH